MRSILPWVIVVLAAVSGCGASGGNSAGGGAGGSGGKSAAELRKELSQTTERMDGAMSQAVEENLKHFESGKSGWGWPILDDQILNSPNFSAETKAAYKRWREAKIAEDKNKK